MNAIEAAVMPLKTAAIARAVKYAEDIITQTLAELEAAGWDQKVAAPYPNGRMGRMEYRVALAKYERVNKLTMYTKGSLRSDEPNIRVKSEEREAHFLKQTAEDAGAQYDAFVAKLCAKIGHADAAILQGSHVWGHSILTVTKSANSERPIAVTERWKTQTIINVSKLGKVFNQWPTRKVK